MRVMQRVVSAVIVGGLLCVLAPAIPTVATEPGPTVATEPSPEPTVATESSPEPESAGETQPEPTEEANPEPVVSDEPAPSVTVSAHGDPLTGHIVVHIEIFHLDAGARTMRVELFKGGEYDAVFNLPCPAVSDPGLPGLTHRCDAVLTNLTEPGEYGVILTRALAEPVETTVVVAPFVFEWWNAYDVTRLELDPATGLTDVGLTLPFVPGSAGDVVLTARTDNDGDGTPDTTVATISCSNTSDRAFACGTGDDPLPALCTNDAFGAPSCTPGRYHYWFAINGHLTSLVHEAVYQQLSDYNAGVREAAADHAAGGVLQDVVDLDSFVLGSSEVCRTENAPGCHDNGYYTEWMHLLIDQWPASLQYFEVNRQGSTATVSAAALSLPQGTHGTHLEIEYGPVDDPASRSTLACAGASCPDVQVEGLGHGDYDFTLNVVNDHPRVSIVTYDGDPQQWGQDVLASSHHDIVPEFAPSLTGAIDIDPSGGQATLTVDLWDVRELPAPYLVHVTLDDPSAGEVWFSADVHCPPFSDSARPRVTHRCSIPLDSPPHPGTYLLSAGIGDEWFDESVDVTVEDVHGWWENAHVVSSHTDMFTGSTDIQIEFPDAPPGLDVDHLELWKSGDGGTDQPAGTISCTRSDHDVLTCGAVGLAPLCSDTAFTSNCSGSEAYLLRFNGHTLGLTIRASFKQLSRYEEGAFFGGQDFADGTPYDVGDYTLTSSDVCTEVDQPHCFDDGYYTTWMARFVQSFTSANQAIGFTVTTDRTAATVSVRPPVLPTGSHGVTLQLAFGLTGEQPNVVDLVCGASACDDVVLRDLSPGAYDFALRAFNQHPQVTIVDVNGSELPWGRDVLASITHAPVDIVAPTTTVRGRVTGTGAVPLRGIAVTASRHPGTDAPLATRWLAALPATTTDVKGEYAFAGLEQGVYTLAFADPRGRYESTTVRDVVVGASGRAIDVSLSPVDLPAGHEPEDGAINRDRLPDTGGPSSGLVSVGVWLTLLGAASLVRIRRTARR